MGCHLVVCWAMPKPRHKSRSKSPASAQARFAGFLLDTLGPDLIASGREFTGRDVIRCGKLISAGRKDAKFARFLKGTLVPDLRASGFKSTAKDLARCARLISPAR